MATLSPGTPVSLLSQHYETLAYPPPAESDLYVAVHEGSLRAGERNRLTQLIAIGDGAVSWVGAVDERMLTRREAPAEPHARALLVWTLQRGAFGEIIWPGDLARSPVDDLFTVYQKSRPWVVLGELDNGSPVAAPLNDATHPLWFTPVIEEADILMPGPKRAQLELAHLWSFPAASKRAGSEIRGQVSPTAMEAVGRVMQSYFGLR